MNVFQFQELKKIICDMRFMQAAALIANGHAETKEAKFYMRKLSALDKLIDDEINKGLKDAQ